MGTTREEAFIRNYQKEKRISTIYVDENILPDLKRIVQAYSDHENGELRRELKMTEDRKESQTNVMGLLNETLEEATKENAELLEKIKKLTKEAELWKDGFKWIEKDLFNIFNDPSQIEVVKEKFKDRFEEMNNLLKSLEHQNKG